MAYSNFIKLKDISTVAPLWANAGVGQEVVLLATSFDISSGNIISSTEKTFQDTNIVISDKPDVLDVDMSNNYNRRKSNVSYGGFTNPSIKITCVYSEDKIGNTIKLKNIDDTKIFNPSKLFEIILKPRTLYLIDEILVPLLQSEQDGSPKVYGVNGMPVILESWTIVPSLEGKEIVMTLVFKEDKGTV